MIKSVSHRPALVVARQIIFTKKLIYFTFAFIFKF
ncbi:MAG: hypothetical protein RL172_3354 [Bacteroidota bacterium]|jgi:hypothetical protein